MYINYNIYISALGIFGGIYQWPISKKIDELIAGFFCHPSFITEPVKTAEIFSIFALVLLTLFITNPALAAVVGRFTPVEGQVDLLKM